MKGYLANGLFSIGDRYVNSLIANKVRRAIPGVDLYVPQENDAINDKEAFADSLLIAKLDYEALMASDFLVAVIDGVEIDSGVAAEIGAFATTGKPIFALYSDVRQQGRSNQKKINALIEDGTENQFMYRNLFVVGLIKSSKGGIFSTVEDLAHAVGSLVN
ncbi:nucleoside 2-deoxyribosyltransferase [Heyndrickxia sporothermodurans]|uniref:nucleoside 2-deoxyribosyltransferase n=1 Tax=Heyndrickxia sporothermodurans TaxID=46224 RepID=UPI000D38BA93|nr:nucleoside 2-deoxyribosyltransferase [Heyndrickxia sporothermodurans]PTY93069.1 nucleoside 2-deoxyribosyltransferase [Heyndrickxia sporothermodurans]